MINPTDLYAASLDGAGWHKSSYTGNNGQCVEIAQIPALPAVAIRDSKNLDVPPLRVSKPALRLFVDALASGALVEA